ncbi:hypothetical protein H0H87_006623 [Tephrocybe sp. NHM501043]|nr:hypothetical protein H0H87_006623 [Tephrocybe sp. NHM501043]
MVVAILAVLKAGAAYVPLDGNVASDDTLQHALDDSGASLLAVQRKFNGRVNGVQIPLILENTICQGACNHCAKPADLGASSTTGTTPKGVIVLHSNVVNRE